MRGQRLRPGVGGPRGGGGSSVGDQPLPSLWPSGAAGGPAEDRHGQPQGRRTWEPPQFCLRCWEGSLPPASHTHLHRLPVGPQAAWRDRETKVTAGRPQTLAPAMTKSPGVQLYSSSGGRPTPPAPGLAVEPTVAAGGHTDVHVCAEKRHALRTEAAFRDRAGVLKGAAGSGGLAGPPCPLGLGAREEGRALTPGRHCHCRSSTRGWRGRRAGTPCRQGRRRLYGRTGHA